MSSDDDDIEERGWRRMPWLVAGIFAIAAGPALIGVGQWPYGIIAMLAGGALLTIALVVLA